MLIYSKNNKIFEKKEPGTIYCGNKCATNCHNVEMRTEVDNMQGEPFYFRDHINCKTSNVIYGNRCEQMYEVTLCWRKGVHNL